MKVRLKSGLLIVTAESPEEKETLAVWAELSDGHVFSLNHQDAQTFRLTDLGPRAEACREPINVTSRSTDPAIQLISNFAHTPFVLDGLYYASIESFWQGLKFPEESRRREIAPLFGNDAHRAGADAPMAETFLYNGREIRIGGADHWRVMAFACWAKFNQHTAAKEALLSTGARPLQHKTRKDSKNIPGVVMSDIWMKVRTGLVKRLHEPSDDDEEVATEEE